MKTLVDFIFIPNAKHYLFTMKDREREREGTVSVHLSDEIIEMFLDQDYS